MELDKFIFLDIDGVLNDCQNLDNPFHDDKMLLLKKIVDNTQAKIILSSTWRVPYLHYKNHISIDSIDFSYMSIIDTTFHQYNLTLHDCTGDLEDIRKRPQEIIDYLSHHQCQSFIVIDDMKLNWGQLSKHLIQTVSYYGLTKELVDKAIKLLNKKE